MACQGQAYWCSCGRRRCAAGTAFPRVTGIQQRRLLAARARVVDAGNRGVAAALQDVGALNVRNPRVCFRRRSEEEKPDDVPVNHKE